MSAIPTRRVSPTPAMAAYVTDLKAVLARHVHLTPQEMLAGAAQFVAVAGLAATPPAVVN